MTREQAKKWKKEIKWFTNGGNLWWYCVVYGWTNEKNPNFTGDMYIMEDEFFEVRKSFALGKTIQYKNEYTNEEWKIIENPLWQNLSTYRVKPNEQVYYYLWEKLIDKKIKISLDCIPDNDEESWFKNAGWRRIEDSKRTWEE